MTTATKLLLALAAGGAGYAIYNATSGGSSSSGDSGGGGGCGLTFTREDLQIIAADPRFVATTSFFNSRDLNRLTQIFEGMSGRTTQQDAVNSALAQMYPGCMAEGATNADVQSWLRGRFGTVARSLFDVAG